MLKVRAQWGLDPLEEAWRKWWQTYPEGNMRNLPLIYFWGVWLARNKILFQEKDTPTATIAINCAAIYFSIPVPDDKNTQKNQEPVNILEGIPWAFFDGASQNNRAGAGLCIHLNSDHSIKESVGLGPGTNNHAELSTLHLLLCWLLQRHIFSIQIFRDSLNVIKWVNGNASCHNQILKTLVEEIMFLKSSFNRLSFFHIYRDKNEEADHLSKAGLQQDLGVWSIAESRKGQTTSTQQAPYVLPM